MFAVERSSSVSMTGRKVPRRMRPTISSLASKRSFFNQVGSNGECTEASILTDPGRILASEHLLPKNMKHTYQADRAGIQYQGRQ